MRLKISFHLFCILAIASIGGLLFGYTTGVIAPALLFLESAYQMSGFEKGFLVSIAILGGLFGAITGGFYADRLGRKLTLVLSSILFILSSLFLMLADSILGLLMGRLLIGYAIGIFTLIVPLYIAEMAPASSRGGLVTLNQLAITIGILLSFLLGYAFSNSGNWRALFGLGLVPAGIQLFGLLFLPETPYYLISRNKIREARGILQKYHLEEAAVLSEIEKHERSDHHLKWRDLFRTTFFPALLIGVGLSFFQQATGINAIIYYAPQIFKMAGFGSNKALLLATVGLGVVNVIATTVALTLLDRSGRRPLLLIGLAGMFFSLLLLSAGSFWGGRFDGFITILSLLIYIISFAVGLGVATWVLISEIFPLQVRGRAMGLSIFFNWATNYFIALTFLDLVSFMGRGGTFLIYAIIALLGYLFIYKKVPETKGKTLDEIEEFWKTKRS